jgi:hypothetical protein
MSQENVEVVRRHMEAWNPMRPDDALDPVALRWGD